MKKYFEVYRQCSLFNGIADEGLTATLECLGAKNKKYKKGQTIFSEGESAERLGIVLSGIAQVSRVDYRGNRTILADIEPPQIFGEVFACAEIDALPIDVIAAENTEVMFIDARRLTKSCNNACFFHSQIIFNLLKIVAAKNLTLHRKIEITSKRSTREKLMTYLMLQAKENGSNSFTISYDRRALADYLEVERSGLSAEISKLRREGVIDCKRSSFRLK